MDEEQRKFRSKITGMFFSMIGGIVGALICFSTVGITITSIATAGITVSKVFLLLAMVSGAIGMMYFGNAAEKRMKLYITGFYTDEEYEEYGKRYGGEQWTSLKQPKE